MSDELVAALQRLIAAVDEYGRQETDRDNTQQEEAMFAAARIARAALARVSP